jgi:translation initiation factor 2 subunit 1
MAEMRVPRKGELVLVTVAKISNFGAYCKLIEYDNVEAFLPIREVSSGWIKNIREFIHEGQKLVCFVNNIDPVRGTIDVSLKKVSTKDSKDKIRAYNLEKRLSALFIQSIKSAGETKNKDQIISITVSEFQTYTMLVQEATNGTEKFKESKIPKKVKESLIKVLEQNKKERKYIVSYIANISTNDMMSGAERLTEALNEIRSKGVKVLYVSAPKYKLIAEGKDYADAEGKIKAAEEAARKHIKDGTFIVEKEKLKKEKEDIMESI